ncbi:unnamed protein product [Hermetia illucens]|uniref:Uncharacterized protein n=1 Tax=Hermetia illucens TaxID=343691 RepID=A0A7R8UYQ3_HERIL|nr:unnamed protein product [Hermetia illucens]
MYINYYLCQIIAVPSSKKSKGHKLLHSGLLRTLDTLCTLRIPKLFQLHICFGERIEIKHKVHILGKK